MSQSTIHEVFEFVEDDCDLKIELDPIAAATPVAVADHGGQ